MCLLDLEEFQDEVGIMNNKYVTQQKRTGDIYKQ